MITEGRSKDDSRRLVHAIDVAGGFDAIHLTLQENVHEDEIRLVETDPADATASPFGWHDDDGVAGADSTFTVGNNVIAQEDIDILEELGLQRWRSDRRMKRLAVLAGQPNDPAICP